MIRHFVPPRTVLALPFGMQVSPATRVLVAPTGLAQTMGPGRVRTGSRAVTVAAITVATNHDGGAAAGAQVASSRNFHWRSGPMGIDDNVRFVKYSACNVACWLRARRWL